MSHQHGHRSPLKEYYLWPGVPMAPKVLMGRTTKRIRAGRAPYSSSTRPHAYHRDYTKLHNQATPDTTPLAVCWLRLCVCAPWDRDV